MSRAGKLAVRRWSGAPLRCRTSNRPDPLNRYAVDQDPLGIRPARPQIHANPERLADRVLDRDDPGLGRARLALERRLRVRAVALGARLGALGGVAGGSGRGHAERPDPRRGAAVTY